VIILYTSLSKFTIRLDDLQEEDSLSDALRAR